MKLDFLAAGRLRMRKSIYKPAASKEELIDLPVISALIRHPSGNVLFDTGCSPKAATDPEGHWGPLARVMQPAFTEDDTVVASLQAHQLEPGDIDLVICSHLHPDHCGCAAAFTRATVMTHQAELDAAMAEGAEKQGYLPQDWQVPQGYTTFTDERDLFGDGRMVLLPLPGHSPGMSGMHVSLERDGTFLLASDAAPMMCHVDEQYAPKNTWDVDKALATLAAIREEKERGTTVICGHDDEQWQALSQRTGSFE